MGYYQAVYLTTSHLPHYLLSRGLVTYESVVSGDFLAVPVSGRHHNFKVLRRQAPSLFVKQVTQPQAALTDHLKREADCYALVGRNERLAGMREIMPQRLDYDSRRHTLTVTHLSQTENLLEHHGRTREFPCDVARLLARSVAKCHNLSAGLDTDDVRDFPRLPPRALAAHRDDPSRAADNPVARAMLGLIQQTPHLISRLERLRAEWRCETLIHGDVKWENALIDRQTETRVCYLVDWEMCDFGDPAWDLAGILHSYLRWTVYGDALGLIAGAGQASLLRAATSLHGAATSLHGAVPSLHRAVNACWSTYAQDRDLHDREAFLDRTLCYTGVRLMQAAYEWAQLARNLDAQAMCLFQTGASLLLQPSTVAARLLGLNSPGQQQRRHVAS